MDKRLERAVMRPKTDAYKEYPLKEYKPNIVERVSHSTKPATIPGGMVHSELMKYQIVRENI
jgi:hypothetical protein